MGHAFPPERPRRRHRNRGWDTPSITSEQACAKGAPLGTKAGCSGRGSYSIIAHLDCVAGSRGVLLELVPPEGVLGLYSRRASVVETSTMLFLQRKISRQSLKHKWAHRYLGLPTELWAAAGRRGSHPNTIPRYAVTPRGERSMVIVPQEVSEPWPMAFGTLAGDIPDDARTSVSAQEKV